MPQPERRGVAFHEENAATLATLAVLGAGVVYLREDLERGDRAAVKLLVELSGAALGEGLTPDRVVTVLKGLNEMTPDPTLVKLLDAMVDDLRRHW